MTLSAIEKMLLVKALALELANADCDAASALEQIDRMRAVVSSETSKTPDEQAFPLSWRTPRN